MRSILAVVLVAASAAANAQAYPTKPIRWMVPSAATGAFDNLTRAIAPLLGARLGQTLVVENRPGSAGLLGMEQAARATPDGYTVLTAGTSQLIFNKFFYSRLPYDPQKDFAPVTMLADLPIALWAHTSVPANNLKELVAYAKANPGKLNYGSAGVGHIFHLGMEMIAQRSGIEIVHVPFKGVAPAQQEVLAGRVQLIFGVAQASAMAQWKAGQIKPIVAATEKRMPQLPEVLTLAESGVQNIDVPNWIGFVVPTATPKDIVARLNNEMAVSIASPELTRFYELQSMLKDTGAPEAFGRRIDREIEAWGPIIRKLRITLD